MNHILMILFFHLVAIMLFIDPVASAARKWTPPRYTNTPGGDVADQPPLRYDARPPVADPVEQQKEVNAGIEKYNDVHSNGEYNKVKVLMAEYYKKASKGTWPKYDPITSTFDGAASVPADFNDGTELTANADVIDNFLGGDITPTVEQMQNLIADVDGEKRRKRKVDSNANRWTRSISYKWAPVDSEEAKWRSQIRAGIALWEQQTCLRFVENGNDPNYIIFTRSIGCFSNIGRTGGQQAISIGFGCERIGIVSHEIGHALGLWHEQMRPDRDSHIRINTPNILQGRASQFVVHQAVEFFDGAYDMGSVMHYSNKAFASSDRRTIDTLDSKYTTTIGQRTALSFIDVKQINNVYCSDVCHPITCQHGGYANPTSCSECHCPSGFGGKDCGQVQSSDAGCGGTLTSTTDWQTLASPTIGGSQSCNYQIDSPPGSRIVVEITRMNMPCPNACYSFIELKMRTDVQQTGYRFCCEDNLPPAVWSEANRAVVMHRTDEFAQSGWLGWEIRYMHSGSSVTTAPSTAAPTTTTTVATTTTTTTTTTVTTTSTTATTTTTQWTTTTAYQTRSPTSITWGNWTTWSACSATCGMCGTQARTRTCTGSGCVKANEESRKCGKSVCPSGTDAYGTCKGTIRAPCDLISRLRMDGGGTVNQMVAKQAAQVNGVSINWDSQDAQNGAADTGNEFVVQHPQGDTGSGECVQFFTYGCTRNGVGTCCGYYIAKNTGLCETY